MTETWEKEGAIWKKGVIGDGAESGFLEGARLLASVPFPDGLRIQGPRPVSPSLYMPPVSVGLRGVRAIHRTFCRIVSWILVNSG